MKKLVFQASAAPVLAIVATIFLQACDHPDEQRIDPVAEVPQASEVSGLDSELSGIGTAIDLSILEVMQLVITPATDTLWGVGNPQSDEDWAELERAAAATITGATLTALGGSGPQDFEWASSPAYQALNAIMLDAAKASLEAARAKDLDALFEAGDMLYPPCEACHLQFNPGVINQPQ